MAVLTISGVVIASLSTLATIAQTTIFLASMAYQLRQARKARKAAREAAEARKGFQLVSEGQVETLPIVYGKALIGGTRVYHNTSSSFVYADPNGQKVLSTGRSATPGGTLTYQSPDGGSVTETYAGTAAGSLNQNITGSKNEFLFFQQALCLGPINAVYDVVINENTYIDDPALGDTHTEVVFKNGAFVKDSSPKAALRFDFHYNGGADSIMAANFNDRAAAEFNNIAYLSAVIRLDRDEPQFNQIPNVQTFIEGRKVKTIDAAYALSIVKTYSNNPAYCLLDYLLDNTSGKGLTVDQIDLVSFRAAALVCDTVVQNNAYVGGKLYQTTDKLRNTTARNLPLYECNIIVDVTKPTRDNVESILATMGDARLVWSQGKYKLLLQYPSNNDNIVLAATLTDDDLAHDTPVELSWPTASDRLNHCIVRFSNESENFKEDSVSWPPKTNRQEKRGIGGKRYIAVSGWEAEKEGGAFLNNYAVWSGGTETTTLTWKVIPSVTGVHTVKYTADSTATLSISTYSGTQSDWRFIKTGTVSLTANVEYTITINASNSAAPDGRGVAGTLTDPSSNVIWTTRSESYSSFINIAQTNTVYTQMLTEDNNVQLETDIFAEGVTDYYHALAKAEELVRTSRTATAVTFQYIVKNKYLEPGDIIRINSNALNLGVSSALYVKIDEIKLQDGAIAEVKGTRFDYTQLAWSVKDDQYIKPANIYNFFLSAPSALIYTPGNNVLTGSPGTLTWGLSPEPSISGYILYFHEINDLAANGQPNFVEIGRAAAPPFYVPDLKSKVGIFGIRAFTNSITSDMTVTSTTQAFLVDVNLTPPTATGVSSSRYGTYNQSLIISWTIPSNRAGGLNIPYDDHSFARVYRAVYTTGEPTYTEIGTSRTGFLIDYTPVFGTLRYKVKLVSSRGLEGALSAASTDISYSYSDFTNTAQVIASLSNSITSTQLNTTLNNRINLIDTPTTGLVTKVGDLETTFGSTTSAANSAAAASTAANNASTASNNASTAASNASNAATNASNFANNASNSATNSQTFANSAQGYSNTAQQHASNSFSYSNSAANSASNANSAASSANSFSVAATNAATNAQSYANNAQGYSNSAQQHAANSLSFSNNASNSATNATQSASNASNSAILATNAATNAQAYSNSAQGFSNTAQQHSANALTHSNNAANSFTNANSAASNASNSASLATNAASNAQTYSNSAQGFSNTAQQHATNSFTYSNSAANSASNANGSASVATTQAGISTNAATNAQTYANSAQGFSNSASSFSTNAQQYAQAAANSASNANSAASTANTEAGIATSARNAAQGFSNAASTSAASASSFANNASTSANSASNSSTSAATSSSSALTYSQNASNSATSASGFASSAANSFNQIQAVATGFDSAVAWNFEEGLEGWVTSGASATYNSGIIRLSSSGTDPIFQSPSTTVNGQKSTLVRARVKRVAGSGWDGTLYYSTSSSGIALTSSMFTIRDLTNNTLGTTRNGLSIGLAQGSSTWAIYQNLPSYLLNKLCTVYINDTNSSTWTLPACRVYMLKQPTNWAPVDTSGWTYLENGNYINQATSTDVFYKDFTAGNHTFDTFSAMYVFAPLPNSAAHGYSASYRKVISDTTNTTDWKILEWDMSALSAGGADWTTSTIETIRIDLGASSSDQFDIDWITIGRLAPQAYSAAIAQKMEVRSASNGVSTAAYSLVVDTNGRVSGFGLSSETDTTTGAQSSAFIVNADKFAITNSSNLNNGSKVIPFIVANNTVYIDNAMIKDLTADKLDTRNLTVKDGSGNIILSSGNALSTTYIQDAAVTTLKIAGNAVTVASTGSGNSTDNSGYGVLLSVNDCIAGQPVIIMATFNGLGFVSTTEVGMGYTVYINKGSTELGSAVSYALPAGGGALVPSVTIITIDQNVTTGTNNYYAKGSFYTGYGSPGFTTRVVGFQGKK